MVFSLEKTQWIFEPKSWKKNEVGIEITTDPGTDFWQRTYYGFRNDNSPGLLMEIDESFTFTVKTGFEYRARYDQCGILIYLDSGNWMKAGLEYENESYSRLGSVVTNNGYSDWATTDIANRTELYYRLHRRGPDFMLESSYDGLEYRQMRIFHMHSLGETTEAMGKEALMNGKTSTVKFGIYASSPGDASFTAKFSEIELEKCNWKAH